MENEEKKKLKYVPPTIEAMMFEPGNILAGSTNSIGTSSGGWKIDNGDQGGTGASTGGWSSDGSGGTGASTGNWSKD